MAAYIALLRKQADSDFGMEFPDLQEVIAACITLENARHIVAEALLLHIERMREDGETRP